MTTTVSRETTSSVTTEHFDVLIVGAGISGIGVGLPPQDPVPRTRASWCSRRSTSFGGTWRTHRYPGIRSDSDLYTFGYRFKPWTGAPIATADEILKYMGEVIEENDLAPHIRYHHHIDVGHVVERGQLLDASTRPAATGRGGSLHHQLPLDVPGLLPPRRGLHARVARDGSVQGPIVHPQTWPEDLDYKGKNVVVIGSGATAATLVPAIADDCAHVTLLQRSPTYFVSRPQRERARRHAARARDPRGVDPRDRAPQGPARPARSSPSCSVDEPEWSRRNCLIDAVRAELPPGYDVEKHFTPKYRPWRQRLALRARRRPLQGDRLGPGVGRHRRDRDVHRERHPLEVRRGAGGRHHRHGDGLQPERARRHRLHCRRRATSTSPTPSRTAG